MPFVLDASITACWAFDDESHPHAASALDRLAGDHATAPCLWWYEIRNILLVNERRGRISPRDVAKFLGELRALPVKVDQSPDEVVLFSMARKHRLTIYDAAYLELARREGMPLATLDADLAKAAKAENLPLVGQDE